MRTEKEVKDKIEELREKAFDIMDKNLDRSINKRVSIRSIRLIIDALEYSLGKRKELMLLTENYSVTAGGKL